MGALMAEDDVYIGTLMEQFNLRFGLSQTEAEFSGGGKNEIAVLQSEFKIFRTTGHLPRAQDCSVWEAYRTTVRRTVGSRCWTP